MKVLSLICSVALVLSLFELPIGYYTFLRILVTIGAAAILVNEIKQGYNFWVFAFGITAIIFNPIIPIYLGDKSMWMPIDLIAALIFLIKGIVIKNSSDSSTKNQVNQ